MQGVGNWMPSEVSCLTAAGLERGERPQRSGDGGSPDGERRRATGACDACPPPEPVRTEVATLRGRSEGACASHGGGDLVTRERERGSGVTYTVNHLVKHVMSIVLCVNACNKVCKSIPVTQNNRQKWETKVDLIVILYHVGFKTNFYRTKII